MVPKGSTKKEICDFIRNKLISGGLSDKLIIIDPYMFSFDVNNTNSLRGINPSDILIEILEPIKNDFQSLELIFDKNKKSNRPEQHKEILERNLAPLKIEISRSEAFHDRFWIIDENKAFMIGSSLTGFGKRHFFIPEDFFNLNDTKDLLRMYKKDTFR